MPAKSKSKTASKRTKVNTLKKPAKSLSGKSMKKVKGGGTVETTSVRKAGEKPVEY